MRNSLRGEMLSWRLLCLTARSNSPGFPECARRANGCRLSRDRCPPRPIVPEMGTLRRDFDGSAPPASATAYSLAADPWRETSGRSERLLGRRGHLVRDEVAGF